MRWSIQDIRVDVTKKSASYVTQPGWHAMQDMENDASVLLCNAGVSSFIVKDAPCTVMATGDVGTIIQKGGCGSIDAVAAESPWTTRFTSCLEAIDACSAELCIIGVIDAPPIEHIYEALEAVRRSSDAMRKIYAHPRKLLLLAGPETVLYPNFSAETHDMEGVPHSVQGKQITFTNELWTQLSKRAHWGCVIYTVGGIAGLAAPLSILIGSYKNCTPKHVVIPYPQGHTCPREAMHLMKYSKNIATESVRVSNARGIAVQPTDFAEVVATVVLQDNADESEEQHEMTLLRTMLTSVRPAEVGAACFELQSLNLPCSLIQRATQHVMGKQRANIWANLSEPPPLLRQASVANAHSECL